jgi:hypothetical protein
MLLTGTGGSLLHIESFRPQVFSVVSIGRWEGRGRRCGGGREGLRKEVREYGVGCGVVVYEIPGG